MLSIFCVLQIHYHDETHYKKPISFPGNALKLTHGNEELQHFSGVLPPEPRFMGGEGRNTFMQRRIQGAKVAMAPQ